MQRKNTVCLCAAMGALIATTSTWAAVEVMYCQITGHPKAVVPSGAGLAAGTEFKVQTATGFDRPFASPDGTKIFFTGLANVVAAEDECYIVAAVDGSSASTNMREGTMFGSPTAELLGTGNQRMGINNAGQFAVVVNQGTVTAVDKCVIVWNGVSFNLLAREGSDVPGFPGEPWGDGLNSAHVLADGTGLFLGVSTGGPLPANEDDFCMEGNTVFIQAGDAIEAATWSALNVSNYYRTSDGAHWMLVGDDSGAAATNRVLAVDGEVKVREGTLLAGTSFTSNVNTNFGTAEYQLAEDGSYMIHGSNADAIDWVYRNGVVVAQTDTAIVPASTELFDDAAFAQCFFTIAQNSVGDYVVGGTTNAVDANANAVMVLNGDTVIARENDPVDLNGNGLADDDAFIGTFNNSDAVLTDDLQLVCFADVRNAALASIGQMVLRLDLAPSIPCPADIFVTGEVDLDDLLAVINSFGADCSPCKPTSCAADVDDDCDVDLDDLLFVINSWGICD